METVNLPLRCGDFETVTLEEAAQRWKTLLHGTAKRRTRAAPSFSRFDQAKQIEWAFERSVGETVPEWLERESRRKARQAKKDAAAPALKGTPKATKKPKKKARR